MKLSIVVRYVCAVALTLLTQMSTAGTWHYLESPALTGLWPGSDGLWTSGDPAGPFAPPEGPFGPLPISGLTPTNDFGGIVPGTGGGASISIDSSGFFGTSIGMFVTNGGAPDGPGVNPITSYSGDGLFHHDAASIVDFSAGFFLDPAGVNEIVVDPAGRTFTVDVSIAFPAGGLINVFTASGFNLFAGEDPFSVFAGDPALAAHFDFLAPLAPAGWSTMSTTFWTGDQFSAVDGSPLGISSDVVSVAYTFDALVPIPPAFMLFASAIAGLMGIRAMRPHGSAARRSLRG